VNPANGEVWVASTRDHFIRVYDATGTTYLRTVGDGEDSTAVGSFRWPMDVEFAARCGVNVCAMAVRDALGEHVETISKYAIGRRCVFPYYDLQAVRTEMAAGRLGLLGWASSWIGPHQPVFRWSDPLPAVGEIASLIGKRLRRVGARAQRTSTRV